jgi:phosphatidylinositol 4-kinase B
MSRLQQIFANAQPPINLWLRPYEIVITSNNSGFIECIKNTCSIDGVKKQFPANKKWSLADFFAKYFFFNFEEA